MIIIILICVATTPLWITFFGHLIASFLRFYLVFALVLALMIFLGEKTGLTYEINQFSMELGIPTGIVIILSAFVITLKLTARKR